MRVNWEGARPIRGGRFGEGNLRGDSVVLAGSTVIVIVLFRHGIFMVCHPFGVGTTSAVSWCGGGRAAMKEEVA